MKQVKRVSRSHTRASRRDAASSPQDLISAIANPMRTVTGLIEMRDDRVMLSVAGLSLELLTASVLPESPAALRAARAATAKTFAAGIGRFATVLAQQSGTTLLSARPVTSSREQAAGDRRFAKVNAVIAQRRDALLKIPGVLGIRPGYKFSNGWITNQPCIVFVVWQKLDKAALSTTSRIPATVDGVATDVAPASPLVQLMAQNYRGVAPEMLANPLGMLLPGAPVTASAAIEVETQAATQTYVPPPHVKLDPVKGPMSVLCHASPDAGWPTLKAFLDKTTKSLTVAMYDFTAPHIVRDLTGVFAHKGKMKLVLDPREAIKAGGRGKNPKAHDEHETDVAKDLRDAMKNRFDFTWAAVKLKGKTTGGLFPMAYHIKVAVRDSEAMWLSSGNWQSSNQPDLDPIKDKNQPANLRTTFNREWHVVVEGKPLSQLYEAFINWDFSQAVPFEVSPDRTVRPELLVSERFGAEAAVTPPRFFAPKTVALKASDRVIPLLTPDNYADHVIALIRSAKKSIRFQNQYITISETGNPPKFEALVDALREQIDAGRDVKIILRDLGHAREMMESLQANGLKPDKHLKFIPTCHNKGIIVDDAVVCLGSHNWSGQGTTLNRDASLIFANKDIAAYYAEIFDYDWTWAKKVLASESDSPQLAMGTADPAGATRVPWDAYFGDDYRLDEALDHAESSSRTGSSVDVARSIIAGTTPLDIAKPPHPALHAVKAQLSTRYLTSRHAVRTFEHAAGISPVPEVNVLGVGLGEMVSGNQRTGLTSVKLFVRKKYPKEYVAGDHMLPNEMEGVPVDVEEMGDLRPLAAALDPRIQITPAQPGCSVGFKFPVGQERMAGTLGALVRDARGKLYLLSNNHVLADEGRLRSGAPIFQQGLLDLPVDSHPRRIAKLTRFSDFKAADLRIDAAIAQVLDPGLLSPEILYIGAPQGTEQAAVDMTVHKFGRTSFYTVGQVTSIATDITVDYATGSFTFKDQIVVEGVAGQPFSDGGDSGSLIINRQTGRAVGLLFAGSSSHTIANHIDDVLSGMQVTLA